MTNRFVCPAALTALLAAIAGCKGVPDAAPPAAHPADDGRIAVDSAQRAHFKVEAVDSVTFAPEILTTGTVAFSADRSTQVIAPISGPVSQILVNPGDRVVPGQALARVSSADFAAAVASYRKADAAWRNAKRIADLDEQLFANDALARRELDQARTDLAGAVADKEAALIQLQTLGVDEQAIKAVEEGRSVPLSAAIRAPIGGTLVEKLITPGQLLQAGTTPTFTIADLSTVWVMANVFEQDIRNVKRGDLAVVTTQASADSLTGTVDYVAALVDPNTKATAVRLVVPNRGQALKRDMLVQVAIRSRAARRGLLVPVASVLRDDENLPYLFVAMADGSYARRRVSLGNRVGDRYEVRSGLEAGERVVIDGALFLPSAGHQ
jgi:cobalt-zinc-cadmium efflux system membrane fusion protein